MAACSFIGMQNARANNIVVKNNTFTLIRYGVSNRSLANEVGNGGAYSEPNLSTISRTTPSPTA